MRIDEKMDHGPIYAHRDITVTEWPTYEEFEETMAREGARLLAESINPWIETDPLDLERIAEVEQDHSQATFTKKITKEEALLDLDADPYLNFRKIQAYHEWPQAYFIVKHNGKDMRVKVTSASFKDSVLVIEKVVPEGKREMRYEDFKRGYGA